MNRLLNYFKINRGQEKIRYFIILAVVIFNFLYYILFLQNTKNFYTNWYDLIISLLASYMNLAYLYFIAFLLFIYNITSRSNFYKYAFLKLKNKRKWYYYNISNILISSILFTFLIVIQTLLEGIVTLSLRNKWSEYSLCAIRPKGLVYLYSPETFNYVIKHLSPLTYIIIIIALILCFFCSIGLIYLIFSMIFKRKVFAFIGVFLINIINVYMYNWELPRFIKYTFYYNTSVITANETLLNSSIFYNRFLYWIVLILILVLTGHLLLKHIDFNFGDD